jgi:predicted transcriptional regulator
MPMTMTEIDSFVRCARERLESGKRETLEQAMRAWRDEQEHQETLADIRAGLADIEAGRVRPLEDVIRELDIRLGIERLREE